MSDCCKEGVIDNFYMIRIREAEEDALKAARLDELENILDTDERARVEHVIAPIFAVIAFVYDASLVAELESRGYELLPQKSVKMIE